MCLVVLGWQQHAEFPFIAAANRDEFHTRPTEHASWWPDTPNIVGGRDLLAGGSWLALHRHGRFATVTNYRDAVPPTAGYRSRGRLVADFLNATDNPVDYLNAIDGSAYAGFNLLVSDGETLAWLSNRGDGVHVLAPGVYGLSNALLDSPWHKVVRSKAALKRLIERDKVNRTELFRLLGDRERAAVKDICSDHLPLATTHAISASFIVTPQYGTRSSSVALLDAAGRWQLDERRFDADGKVSGNSTFSFWAQ